ncbi:MAG: hypothetical protein AAFR62_17825 [Cyanobacteria bacterium J06629_2]
MNFDQNNFEVRCEWGEQGVLKLAPISDVVIIIDAFSFSTCIELPTVEELSFVKKVVFGNQQSLNFVCDRTKFVEQLIIDRIIWSSR